MTGSGAFLVVAGGVCDRARARSSPAVCVTRGRGLRAETTFDPEDPIWDLDYACIPQTIEFSVRQAQKATAQAFCETETRVSLQMPMGRSRKHWYRMSPMPSWFEESSVLAPHFCEVFKGASIALVICGDPMPPIEIPWIAHVGRLDEALPDRQLDVVVITSARAKQRSEVESLISRIDSSTSICLFNCFLDSPDDTIVDGFVPAYICRYFPVTGAAVLRQGHTEQWDLFAEVAVFEFEWVKVLPADWEPTEAGVEVALSIANYSKTMTGGKFFKSLGSARNAGFWPFHTISQRAVLPLTAEYVKRDLQGEPKRILGFEIPR